MEQIYHRDFNSPEEFSLDNIKKEFGKVVQIDLHFKDAGCEYNLQLNHPHKPTKYNGSGDSVSVEWDTLKEKLSITQISRIEVHRESKSISIAFWRYDDVVVSIVCKDIIGLP